MNLKTLLFTALAATTFSAVADAPYTYTAGIEVEANDNLYKLTGENLIVNGDFTNGKEGWTSYGKVALGDAFKVSADGGPDGGAYSYLQMPADGKGIDSNTALFTIYRLEAGKTYFVSYLGQVKTEYGGILLCGGEQDKTEDGNYTLFRKDTSTGDEWKQYSAVFTVDAAHEYMVFTFRWTSASDRIACVNLFEVEQQVTYNKLEAAIVEAESLYENTTEGSEAGQYPAEARTALLFAIDAARSALAATTVAEVESAVEAINDAIKAYKNARVPYELQENVRYYVKNVWSGNYLNLNWQGDPARQKLLLRALPAIEEGADPAEVNKDFQMVFEATRDNAASQGYNIRSAANDYIYRDSWNIYYPATDLSKNDAIFTVENAEGGQILIKNCGSGKYLAPDDNWSWAPVYADKEINEKAYYLLEPAVPDEYTGVAAVAAEVEADGPVMWFTIDGRAVAAPIAHGLYIRVEGAKATKVLY